MCEIWKRRKGFMINSLVNLSGKLPDGLASLYCEVFSVASALNIDLLVVGAMARDLILVHGFGARLERGTRDVDFAVQVVDWQSFETLVSALVARGFIQDPQRVHRLHRMDQGGLPWEIDLLPFGTIADENSSIQWPPDGAVVMTVLGFQEALTDAIRVQIGSAQNITSVNVASPAGLSLLKLIAWLEREPGIRRKDALDLDYLMKTYSKIPVVLSALYDDGQMEAQEWDEVKASAMKLGQDAAKIAEPNTYDFLVEQLFHDDEKLEVLHREMKPSILHSYYDGSLLKIYVEAFVLENVQKS